MKRNVLYAALASLAVGVNDMLVDYMGRAGLMLFAAKLKSKVAKIEDVEEPLRPYYKEHDKGGFVLDAEDPEELRTALTSERRQVQTLREQIKTYGEHTPETIAALESKVKEYENKVPEIETVRKQLDDKWGGEIKKRDEKVGKLTKTLEQTLIENAAMNAITRAKGNPKLLMPHVRGVARIEEIDGEFGVLVTGSDGKPLFVDGRRATLDDVVTSLKSDESFGGAFESGGASGSGTPPGGGGGASSGQRSKMSPQQKSDFIAKHGQEAYLALPY